MTSSVGDLDWLLLAFSEQKWRCVERARPRRWALVVPVNFVHPNRLESPTVVGYEIVEAAATMRFLDMPFLAILPRGVPYQALQAVRRRESALVRKARQAIERDVEIIEPTPGSGGKWALKHKPSGVTIFFEFGIPWSQQTTDQRRHLLR